MSRPPDLVGGRGREGEGEERESGGRPDARRSDGGHARSGAGDRGAAAANGGRRRRVRAARGRLLLAVRARARFATSTWRWPASSGTTTATAKGSRRLPPWAWAGKLYESPHSVELDGKRVLIVHELSEAAVRSVENHAVVVHGYTHRREMRTGAMRSSSTRAKRAAGCTARRSAAILDLDTMAVEFIELTTVDRPWQEARRGPGGVDSPRRRSRGQRREVSSRILILDYGSQFTQLIARRVREARVYSEIHPPTRIARVDSGMAADGDHSERRARRRYMVTMSRRPIGRCSTSRPCLGICYGMNLIAHIEGGVVTTGERREYGRAELR